MITKNYSLLLCISIQLIPAHNLFAGLWWSKEVQGKQLIIQNNSSKAVRVFQIQYVVTEEGEYLLDHPVEPKSQISVTCKWPGQIPVLRFESTDNTPVNHWTYASYLSINLLRNIPEHLSYDDIRAIVIRNYYIDNTTGPLLIIPSTKTEPMEK